MFHSPRLDALSLFFIPKDKESYRLKSPLVQVLLQRKR